MQTNIPILIRQGDYAASYRIEVDGCSYAYQIRENRISGVTKENSGNRGRLKSGSAQDLKVKAAIISGGWAEA